MPSIKSPSDLSAVIIFTLPDDRLDHDPEIYLTFDKDRNRPTEKIRVPVNNLRDELDSDTGPSAPKDQLAQRGFAVFKHESQALGDIPTVEGTEAYLAETAEIMKNWLGCTKLIAWNSVVRKNDPSVKVKDVPKQQGPEKGLVPTARMQPVAGIAHVDQDSTWGKELVGKAAGASADEYKRAMIVNLWRPLHGPVTNAPLAMLDPTTMAPTDISVHASQFGLGMDIHHSSSQSWSYVRHQMPDEVILLKCYDTEQGQDGSVLYCGHVAVQVDGDDFGVDPFLVRPRESIEVRCVALWE